MDQKNNIKKLLQRTMPITIVVVLTIVMSLVVYDRLIKAETLDCWERLEVATKNTAGRITVRMRDNINFLELVSDSLIVGQGMGNEEQILEYLVTVKETTIFDRIDILYPDDTLHLMTGEVTRDSREFSYEELSAKGRHISHRRTDVPTGKEVIYFFVPINVEDVNQAILIGTIDCKALVEEFTIYSYDGQVQIFLVDLEDGAYLLDNWHETLGNIREMGDRRQVEGYEDVDFVTEIIEGKVGKAAYISNTNNENTYTYYMPIEEFNWEICLAAQEDMVFEHLNKLKRILIGVGIVEVILLLVYYVWNIRLTFGSMRSEEKAQRLELERRANEAKAKFLSNMSHDIRTPLNGIVGMLNVIKNHSEDRELIGECLKKIDISTQYLITLANDMLDINEIESGKLILADETFDLRELANNLSVLMQPKAEKANVSYYVDCSKIKTPLVQGSVVHIQRILVNLISNAIKYTREKEGSVWVDFDQLELDEERGMYRFLIQDNGIGMSEEFQKNMFNAFEQEAVSARSKYEGYGLGLTIVNHLVQAMDGKIEIESKKGEGSTFAVLLPLKFSKEQLQPKIEESEIVDLKGARILLVEDNELNMEIAEVLLTDAGAKVTSAVNGKVALDIFSESELYSFDVILMDLMMPELDGYEATRAIRGLDREDAKAVPIIAMTASTFTEEINRCKQVGMNEHLGKPLDVDALMSKVSKYYHRHV